MCRYVCVATLRMCRYATYVSLRYVCVATLRMCRYAPYVSLRSVCVATLRMCRYATYVSLRYVCVATLRMCRYATYVSLYIVSLGKATRKLNDGMGLRFGLRGKGALLTMLMPHLLVLVAGLLMHVLSDDRPPREPTLLTRLLDASFQLLSHIGVEVLTAALLLAAYLRASFVSFIHWGLFILLAPQSLRSSALLGRYMSRFWPVMIVIQAMAIFGQESLIVLGNIPGGDDTILGALKWVREDVCLLTNKYFLIVDLVPLLCAAWLMPHLRTSTCVPSTAGPRQQPSPPAGHPAATASITDYTSAFPMRIASPTTATTTSTYPPDAALLIPIPITPTSAAAPAATTTSITSSSRGGMSGFATPVRASGIARLEYNAMSPVSQRMTRAGAGTVLDPMGTLIDVGAEAGNVFGAPAGGMVLPPLSPANTDGPILPRWRYALTRYLLPAVLFIIGATRGDFMSVGYLAMGVIFIQSGDQALIKPRTWVTSLLWAMLCSTAQLFFAGAYHVTFVRDMFGEPQTPGTLALIFIKIGLLPFNPFQWGIVIHNVVLVTLVLFQGRVVAQLPQAPLQRFFQDRAIKGRDNLNAVLARTRHHITWHRMRQDQRRKEREERLEQRRPPPVIGPGHAPRYQITPTKGTGWYYFAK
ncbi:hypothetical protein PAPYR_6397 [Paratrimastix pyriformis]|uniref:Uncharacterized protein n=1 Tax=Paratrimastix pyriformis TaxID=342808 RepID=A0ABQ8UL08_9EUKA|nr:hypothetical protein PAPYR_6397 [Paratrimastix pyriformis]